MVDGGAEHHDHQTRSSQRGEKCEQMEHPRHDQADDGQQLRDADEDAEPRRYRGPLTLLAHRAHQRLWSERIEDAVKQKDKGEDSLQDPSDRVPHGGWATFSAAWDSLMA